MPPQPSWEDQPDAVLSANFHLRHILSSQLERDVVQKLFYCNNWFRKIRKEDCRLYQKVNDQQNNESSLAADADSALWTLAEKKIKEGWCF